MLVAALLAQLALRKGVRLAARRLALTRPGAAGLWRERLRLGAVPLSLALWLAALLGASHTLPVLEHGRALAFSVFEMAVSAPLFRGGTRAYTVVDLLALPLAV